MFRRSLVVALIGTQVVFAIPAQTFGQPSNADAQQANHPIVVNRTVPAVTPPPIRPQFSDLPSDAEILKAHVFPEPLLPVGATTPGENATLATALKTFSDHRQPNTLGAVVGYMDAHPTSPWHPSLLLNAGLVLEHQGFVTRAAQDYRIAWNLTRHVSGPNAQAIADRAVGQLLALEARFGHADNVQALIDDIGTRALTGPATEQLANAKQALGVMRSAPAEAFRCGPYALAHMLAAAKPTTPFNSTVLGTRTGPNGISLAGLTALAKQSGFATVAIRRELGNEFAIPGVVHLKAGHFAALLRHVGDRYLLRDATIGGDVWVTDVALNEEASGAMLAADGQIPTGWRVMTDDEAGTVWGRGNATGPEPNGPGPSSPPTPPCSCGDGRGMATYRAYLMEVSLNVYDSPVGYAPSLGPSVFFTLYYNHRESHQPSTFTYSNTGARWTMDWLSYVTDDPLNPNATAALFRRGGSEDTYTGYDSGTGQFAMDTREHAVLSRTSSSPVRYERLLPDGSKEVFAQADGASAYPRRVFMTQSIDPQGNALTFTYDAQLRLVAITDALGQVTTIAYELPQDIWKITAVTDPFGRVAVLKYDDQGRLASTTDVISLSSAFTYDGSGFMTSLSTPYGTSRFTVADSSFNRTLEMTDPMGAKEHLEYRMNEGTIAASDPANVVPAISGLTNGFLNYRNTFYWDRRAMAIGAGDLTTAHLYHWLHLKNDVNLTSSIVESEKAPLENRLWYQYPNQASSVFEGDGRQPTAVARVLDDGTTQLFTAGYNVQGQIIQRIDPLNRETDYDYDSNGIDLLRTKQRNGAGFDVLETRTYNNQHESLTLTDASGQTTTYTYNASGQIATATNAKNETTTYTYNGSNQLTSVTGAVSGATTTLTYDGYGRIRTTTDPDNYTVTADYDAFNRPTRTTYPDGTTDQTQYAMLDVARRKDRLNRWTSYMYDPMRRQTSVRDPLGRVIQREYCTCGSLNALIDANGNKISWDRDVQGRVTKETRPNGSSMTYGYETTTSRLENVTDPKNQTTSYTYFGDNKLRQTTFTNAQIATPSVSFTYDPIYGRVATMEDGIGTTTYGYYPVSTPPTLGATRLASVDGPLTDDTITYHYDELGRIVNRSINGDANSVSWTFDVLGRTDTETNVLGLFLYTYDGPTMRASTVTYPNGQTSAYSYFDNSGDRRLQAIHHKYPNGNTLSKSDYTYDVLGNILTWRQQADNDAVVWTYGYDSADQLTSAIKQATDPMASTLNRYTYAYDPAGNRTMEQIDDALMGATYDNMNQRVSQQASGALQVQGTVSEPATMTVNGKPLTVSTANQFSGSVPIATGTTTFTIAATDANGNSASQAYQVDSTAAGKAFTYDANGNMASDGLRTFEWDARNQLVGVTVALHRTEFTYDGQRRRVRETEKENGIIQSDTEVVWCDTTICEERTANDNAVSRRAFMRGQQTSTGLEFFAADHLGSVTEVTDASANLLARYAFDPWGRRTVVTGTDITSMGFAGFLVHGPSSTQLTMYRAYDPEVGRWLTRDPLFVTPESQASSGFEGFYTYVRNDPGRYTDPLGLVSWHCDYQLEGAVEFKGAAFLGAKCTSECVGGKQVIADVVASGVGLGGAAPVPLPIFLIWSSTTLRDKSSVPDASNLQGKFVMFTAGGAVGWGLSFTNMALGSATNFGSGWDGFSTQKGLDLGAAGFIGRSAVIHAYTVPCQGCK